MNVRGDIQVTADLIESELGTIRLVFFQEVKPQEIDVVWMHRGEAILTDEEVEQCIKVAEAILLAIKTSAKATS